MALEIDGKKESEALEKDEDKYGEVIEIAAEKDSEA